MTAVLVLAGLIPLAILIFLLEKFWIPSALTRLCVKTSCDRVMAEPGEVVTWAATVENHNRLPLPFVRLQQSFPLACEIVGEKAWINHHVSAGFVLRWVKESFSMAGRQSSTHTVRLRFDRRGVYDIGDYQIAVGDLLGFRELPKLGSGKELVIIPARATQRPSIDAFGGFLGDISVRRFILEDPVLTVGFRDYTGREPLKSVSWTRTAVAGKLQVKQFDHTAEQTVTVLLNVSGASETALEACFSLVRTVCETLEKQKIPYGFRTNGNLPGPTGRIESMPDGLGHSHLSNILYALGRADDTCFRSWKALTVEALKHRKAGESFVVVTPPLDADDGEILHRFTAAAVNPVCVLTAEEENA